MTPKVMFSVDIIVQMVNIHHVGLVEIHPTAVSRIDRIQEKRARTLKVCSCSDVDKPSILLTAKCVQSLVDLAGAWSVSATIFDKRKTVVSSARSLSEKGRFLYLPRDKNQTIPLNSCFFWFNTGKSNFVHDFRLSWSKGMEVRMSRLKGCLFRIEDVFLNATNNGLCVLPRRNFKTRRLPRSSSKSDAFVSSKSKGRKQNWLWWLSAILPWRSSGKRLEKLLEKAETENAQILVKTAFTEGYVASGGITKKFLFFAFMLLLLPSLLQLYLHYGLISDHLFSSVKEIVPEEINVNFDDVKGLTFVKPVVRYKMQPPSSSLRGAYKNTARTLG
ncbi:hypothetical protein D918_08329 [Trichuris suis]|nr:hypothetical protein D918_08329 [Trichuris suis]